VPSRRGGCLDEAASSHRTMRFSPSCKTATLKFTRQSDSKVRDPQVGQKPRVMNRPETIDCLDLDHKPFVHQKIVRWKHST
jgi:hypothetical protein